MRSPAPPPLGPYIRLTPAEIRAARGWLGWTQGDLAQKISCHGRTVSDVERGATHGTKMMHTAMLRVFEDQGVTFGNGGVGITVIWFEEKRKPT